MSSSEVTAQPREHADVRFRDGAGMQQFIPGLELSRRFYCEAVRPILDDAFPNLPHAAAHLGPGSDVLGFDTPMSTDHGWYPTVRILLRDEDAAQASPIHEALRQRLPHLFAGFAVDAAESAEDPGALMMQPTTEGPVKHRVNPQTLRAWVWDHLGYAIDQPPDAADWLTFSSQQLRELTAGAVHYDEVGDLTALRQRFAWYPHDIWLYLLAAGWGRIAQEEHLMPRAGYVGDELGSALIGSRLVRDVMNLCFLMERHYAPYPKWFGTAFNQLRCAPELLPVLLRAQQATQWQERESNMTTAYEYLARRHNALGLTAPMRERVTDFFGRPFNVIFGGAFADALLAQIVDPDVQRIAARRLIGSVDQFSDSTDLHDVSWRSTLRSLYT